MELIKTEKGIAVHDVTNGIYSHVGVEKEIRRLVAAGVQVKQAGANEIVLDWSFGGIYLQCGHTRHYLWPITCRIVGTDVFFEAGFFLGQIPFRDSLQWFFEEAARICYTGITFEGEKVPLSFRTEIVDRQARKVVSGLPYNICPFGCQERDGKVQQKMLYPISLQEIDLATHLQVDCIGANVFVCEPLDFIYGGIFLEFFKQFKERTKYYPKLSTFKKLVAMLPVEIDKGTFSDIRQIDKSHNELIFFTAILSFKHIFISQHYNLFLEFWTAIFILSDDRHKDYIHEARVLLASFVEQFWNLFQDTYLDKDKQIPGTTQQWHMLLHLADEVFVKGNLRQNSSAPYKKRILKWMEFAQNLTMEQILENIVDASTTSTPDMNSTGAEVVSLKEVQIGHLRVNVGSRFDRWLLTSNHELVEAKMVDQTKQIIVAQKAAKSTCETVTFGCLNHTPIWEKLSIFHYDTSQVPVENVLVHLRTEEVLCKMVRLSYCNETIFYPLFSS
ncbi:uncharacterized protein LOC126579412 [Anopheles aquasalis]|uniref:uncharacterized protein LOC126579412 n=1 Tax=Anopheles aquasalis TaxID=42839 RepID=UPI00215A9430|nr:uncharacterized protein LOC126579412 [Anopheles aquasalis]